MTQTGIKYSTKDLPLAAYLWTLEGFSVEKTSLSRRTVFFHLENPNIDEAQLNAIVFDFVNGRCSVEPKSYCQKQSDLKDLLHKVLDNSR